MRWRVIVTCLKCRHQFSPSADAGSGAVGCPACGAAYLLPARAAHGDEVTLDLPQDSRAVTEDRGPGESPAEPADSAQVPTEDAAGLSAAGHTPAPSGFRATVDFRSPDAAAEPADAASAALPSGVPAIPNYDILRLLGRGGMAVVWEARHLELDRLEHKKP
jgi:DNA-directed RNA polymerase subunit RPC12/RpoP